MILVDNSVELTIKTFLGLPKRVTEIQVPRARYQEFSESFPKLLDALEEFASSKLEGIDLGEIEWYHRLRNQLYHQGNGLTVENDKIVVYSELAKLLFQRLFGEALDVDELPNTHKLGTFMFDWARFEKGLINYYEFVADTYGRTPNVLAAVKVLREEGKINDALFLKFRKVQEARNKLVHGDDRIDLLLSEDILSTFKALDIWLQLADNQYLNERTKSKEQ